jgi:glucokinase
VSDQLMLGSDLAVGVDVGGTNISAGVINDKARILSRCTVQSHAGRPPGEVIQAIVQAITTALAGAGLDLDAVSGSGIGVGFAGHVNGAQGLVLTSSNLPAWDRHPLRDVLQERLAAPVRLENDANCAAWAEYRFGAGQGSRAMCYVTFSTGFGAGIVIDGRLYTGATGTAGEIGHTVVDPNGPLCTCGKRGCVMAYACGMAIARMACERLASGEPTLLHDLCGSTPTHVSGEAVAEAARRGDPAAKEIMTVAGRYFGIGLSSIVQFLNPDYIVIGGGLMQAGDLVMEPALQALNENIHPVLVDSAKIVSSTLGEDAGLIGAGALVWEARVW